MTPINHISKEDVFSIYKSDVLCNSVNELRQLHKETSASLAFLELRMEQKEFV